VSIKCYHCHAQLELSKGPVARQEDCSTCHAQLRCCKMCHFYDPSHYNQCRESSAERITEKEKANFCDYFTLTSGNKNCEQEQLDAKAKANALFKN